MNPTINRLNDVQSPPQPSDNGRDANGRFVKGHAGGPGNPYGRQVAELRKAALEFVSKEQLRGIFEKMTALALEGSVPAAKFVASYTLGKPLEGVHPDGVDADEWNLYKQTAPIMREFLQIAKLPEPEIFLEFARGLRQAKTVEAAETYLTIHKRETQKEQKAAERKAKRQQKKKEQESAKKEQESKELEQQSGKQQKSWPAGEQEKKSGADEGVNSGTDEERRHVRGAVAQSTQGPDGGDLPLIKVVDGHPAPSTKVVDGHPAPSTKAVDGHPAPLTKVVDGHPAPSTKAVDGNGHLH